MGDKGGQDFTSSAELPCMEYECDLKKYCYWMKQKTYVMVGIILNKAKWEKLQEKAELSCTIASCGTEGRGNVYG